MQVFSSLFFRVTSVVKFGGICGSYKFLVGSVLRSILCFEDELDYKNSRYFIKWYIRLSYMCNLMSAWFLTWETGYLISLNIFLLVRSTSIIVMSELISLWVKEHSRDCLCWLWGADYASFEKLSLIVLILNCYWVFLSAVVFILINSIQIF